MRYELLPGTTLILRGPASFTLLTGEVKILGGSLAQNHKRTIPAQRQLPIETESNAELEILLGKSAETFEVKGSTIPASWRLAADAVKVMGQGKVVILEPTDVGKSTLCVYLVNKLLQDGEKVRVVDADIGQADLGPPTTITRAIPTQHIVSLTDLLPDERLFIGHTSPGYVQGKLIDGIGKLSGEDHQSITIINTDGWVTDPEAVVYKIRLVTEVKSDIVLGLAFAKELNPILSGARAYSMRVEPAKDVLGRSRADRRTTRAIAYRRFLEGAASHRLDLGNVQVSAPNHFPSITVRNRGELRNVLVGILKEDGYLNEIGILTDIENNAIRVYSKPVETRKIELGHVKLSTSGREIGFL